MKKIILFLVISFSATAQDFNFQRSWGTYFGDERFFLQDSKADKLGNIYIVGVFINGTSTSQPVFSTPNSYQTTFGGGDSDGFIAKFNNLGQLTWATYFGGNDTDIITGIDIDSLNNIYIVGSTNSPNNIATANAYQSGINGLSDFFIARFTPNGILDWSSYYGGTGDEGNSLNNFFFGANDARVFISLDTSDNFYIAGVTDSPNLGTLGTFQPLKGQSIQIIAKFSNSGTRIWATYYSSDGSYITSVDSSPTELYIRGTINNCNPNNPSTDNYYGSANGYQPNQLNCISTFLSKFSIEGQRIWSTYYADFNFSYANSVKSIRNKVYFSGTGYGSLIATSGTFQESSGNELPSYLVQFSENGARDWGTFCGSNVGYPLNGGADYGSNITTDDNDGLYLCGTTRLHTNYATAGAYQSNLNGISDGFICKFDNQGQKIWGTYYGGNLQEYSMIMHPYNSNFYAVGNSSSTTGLTTPNCYQPNLSTYDIDNGTPQNIFIAHFEPIPLATTTFNENSFSIYPNPTNGNFTVTIKNTIFDTYTLDLFDIVGKKIMSQTINENQTIINTNNLSKGVYIAKITTNENKSYNTKLIIN